MALERSLRAEVVDLADDDDNDSDDELEIGDANDLRPGELPYSSLGASRKILTVLNIENRSQSGPERPPQAKVVENIALDKLVG